MPVAVLSLKEPYTGWPILKQGFRLFFLGASLWAVSSVLLWMAVLTGWWSRQFAVPAFAWHRHELLFGYAGAIVAGFLLTASANWTARPGLSGIPLLGLFLMWLLGRLAMLVPTGALPVPMHYGIELAFPVVLIAFVGRELLLANNRRNLVVLAIIALHAVGNAVSLVEAFSGSSTQWGERIGMAALLTLLMVIGGRIVPAFTRNWLKQRAEARLPEDQSSSDVHIILVSIVSLAGWVLLTSAAISGFYIELLIASALLLSAALNTRRLGRWRGYLARSEPLVWILHVAYAFIPLGFLLQSLAILSPGWVSDSTAFHTWSLGAVSLMAMGVMTRASLGHTGQSLTADRLILAMYLLLLLSILTRVAAGLGIAYFPLLTVSATAWCLAHAIFILRYVRDFFVRQ